jgi:hypothetical protein
MGALFGGTPTATRQDIAESFYKIEKSSDFKHERQRKMTIDDGEFQSRRQKFDTQAIIEVPLEENSKNSSPDELKKFE